MRRRSTALVAADPPAAGPAMNTPEDQTALEKLNAAIQAFAQDQDPDTPFVVSNALLIWEQTRYDGEDVYHRLRYSVPTESSISSAYGLACAAKPILARDLLPNDEDDDDD